MVRSGMLVDQDGNQNGIYLPAINYSHAHSVVHKDNQNCQLERSSKCNVTNVIVSLDLWYSRFATEDMVSKVNTNHTSKGGEEGEMERPWRK